MPPLQVEHVMFKTQTDFMLVELVESTIWFSWDMGAGKHTIIHPLQVEPASNKVEEEDKWYKVKVERSVSFLQPLILADSLLKLEWPVGF